MSPSDDRPQDPWTDPQTHLDTDPVNAEPTPGKTGPDETGPGGADDSDAGPEDES